MSAEKILARLTELTKEKRAVVGGFHIEQVAPRPRHSKHNPALSAVQELAAAGQIEFSPGSGLIRLPQHEGRPAEKRASIVREPGQWVLRER